MSQNGSVADQFSLKVTLRIKSDVPYSVVWPEKFCIRKIVEGVADSSAFGDVSVLMTDPSTLNQIGDIPGFSVIVTVEILVNQWEFEKKKRLINKLCFVNETFGMLYSGQCESVC